jgi:hypothetical protein
MGIDRDTGANTPVPRPTFAMPLLPMTCITALTAKKARQIRPRLFVRGKFGTGPAWAECRNAAEEHDERFGGLGWPRLDSPTWKEGGVTEQPTELPIGLICPASSRSAWFARYSTFSSRPTNGLPACPGNRMPSWFSASARTPAAT